MADLVITNKQYIYLKIPTKYICIYHQLCELIGLTDDEILYIDKRINDIDTKRNK